VLYGRRAECEQVERLVADAVAGRSGVLLIRGEAGLGKSALLEHAAQQSDGMRVLRAGGVESESELPFAALHQLLRPLGAFIDEIPTPQSSALRGALGLSPAPERDPFLVGAAVLSLLAEAAETQPLLCLVDDAQWLDVPSADALIFASRRLHAEPIAMLFAARDDPTRPFHAPGCPDLRLSGLDAKAADELLATRLDTELPASVRAQVVAASDGNPLALIELPQALSTAQAAGREPITDHLPLTAKVEDAFLAAVRRLPEQTQTLLLIASLDGTGELAVVLAAAAGLGVQADALEAAEAANLVRTTDAGTIEFRHPLVRSAVSQSASLAQRQAVHRAVAEAVNAERYEDLRIWHLAAATSEPDADLADQLEGTAGRATRKSGYAAAASAYERAADLTPTDDERARRLVAAGEAAWLAGRPERADDLIGRAQRLSSAPKLTADIAHLRGLIQFHRGHPADAFRTLIDGAHTVGDIDPDKAVVMLVDASEAAAYAGEFARVGEASALAAELTETGRHEQTFLRNFIVGIGKFVGGDSAGGAPLLRDAIAQAYAFSEPRLLIRASIAARTLGEDDAGAAFEARALAQARQDGAVATIPCLLESSATADVFAGRHSSVVAAATEALQLARDSGQETSACRHLTILAHVEAIQGREEECRAHAQEAQTYAIARGLGMQVAAAEWALGLLELGLGRPAEALIHLETLRSDESRGGSPYVIWTTADFVEAAIRADAIDRAKAALTDLEQFASHAEPSWAPFLPRCRALLSTGADAERHFEEALSLHRLAPRPFEEARTELLMGEHLRRARQRLAARDHLRTALDTLELIGATPWAERARAELRATGETARKRDPSTLAQLTPQELQIARLVADGASNKDVAAQLFLSPRTIDYHLRKVFSKLGIAARGDLPRVLAGEQELQPA
jgi:DNA-binding CsgD family transcriptional regulator